MNKIGKILKLLSIALALLLASLIVISFVFEERISTIFINEVNKKLTRPASAKKINFSLIRRFPNASIQLDELTILSSMGNSDTLVYADKLVISLKLTDLMRNDLTIGRLFLSGGKISLVKDKDGNSNARFWKEGARTDSAKLKVELRSIKVTSTRVHYSNLPGNLIIEGQISDASSKICFINDSISIDANARIIADSISVRGNSILRGPFPAETSLSMLVGPGGIDFNNTEITLNKQLITLTGQIEKPGRIMLLTFTSRSAEITMIKDILPSGIASIIDTYSIGGEARFVCTISGPSGPGSKPVLHSTVEVGSGSFQIPDREVRFRNISMTTDITTEFKDPAAKLIFDTEIRSGEINGSKFYGSLFISNLKDPSIDIIFNGALNPAEIIKTGEIKGIESIDGSVRASLRLYGKPGSLNKPGFKELSRLNRSINLHFSNVSLTHERLPYPVGNINGNLMIADNIWLDEVSFLSGGHRAILNGRISGVSDRLKDPESNIDLTAALWLDKFDIEIIRDIRGRGRSGEQNRQVKKVDDNISLNIDINCDSLIADKFRASLFSGNAGYKKGLLNISSFSLNALDGYVEGNAAIMRSADSGYMAGGWFDIDHIDINEAFRVFNNFGQEQIRAENLKGLLTGNVSLNLLTDNQFKPDIGSLSVTGKYIINQGVLTNFEPVLKLSRFIKLEEIEDIRFSELRNDLIIKDEKIIIPSMDIESSAFNISVSGEQFFGGKHSYHVRLYLSDLLSNKAKSRNDDISEFGIIEDDELGRTSLLLKIEGSPGDSRVSYDIEMLRRGIRQDVQNERGIIRNILNEEYGWYKNDTLPASNRDDTRKFRIVWEEVDSIRTDLPVSEEKRLPLLNLIRKKKKK